MEITPFSQPWIEGFVSEAADLGLNSTQTEALLKQASFMALMQDSNFAAGFNEEMQKQSAAVPKVGALQKLRNLLTSEIRLGGPRQATGPIAARHAAEAASKAVPAAAPAAAPAMAPAAVPGAAQIAQEAAPQIAKEAPTIGGSSVDMIRALGNVAGSKHSLAGTGLVAGMGGLGAMYGGLQGLNMLERNWQVGPEDTALIAMMQNDPTNVEGITYALQARDQARQQKLMSDLQRRMTQDNATRGQMRGMLGTGRVDPFSGFDYSR